LPKFCTTCGKPLQYENAEICPSCGVRLQDPPTPAATGEIRSPFLAVILSFFSPGWGQWYEGKTMQGLKFFGACFGTYVLVVIVSVFLSKQPSAGILVVILFLVYLVLWVYGMYDAYKTAQQINNRESEFTGKSALFWLPVVLLILGIVLIIAAAVIAAFVFGMAGNIS
jgi:hypothetical protein